MTVQEFINEYKNAINDRNNFLKSIYKCEYVPYEDKISDCKRMLRVTSYTNTEPNLFKQDTVSRDMLYLLTIIDRYTIIDIDFTKALEEYNLLCSVDMDLLFEEYYRFEIELPKFVEYEVNRYRNILSKLNNDLLENERSMIGYLDSKLAALGIIGETLNNLIENTVQTEDMIE